MISIILNEYINDVNLNISSEATMFCISVIDLLSHYILEQKYELNKLVKMRRVIFEI